MKVKVCGITCLEDALAAQGAGVDLLGFNFYPPSPRYIAPAPCATITAALRNSRMTLVGVFVNATPAQVQAITAACRLDLAQLAGDEPPEELAALERLGVSAFKTLHPVDSRALQTALERYPAHPLPPAYLIDAYRPGAYGGTGKTADWSLAADLAAHVPILLAGGLRADNVAAAVRKVRPWGVDVASGVERAPGRKDAQQMATFVLAAHAADQER
jgi:phosphoribosylanthranilate isomerase